MKYSRIFFLITTLVIVISSCQKEVDFPPGQNPGPGNPGNPGNPSSQSIIGEYDFINLSAHAVSTVTQTIGGDHLKGVTVSDYTTKNNTGTIKITTNQFSTANLGYSIDTVVSTQIYLNGILISDDNLPFSTTLPSAGSTSTYVKNRADSITITGAFGSVPSGSSGSVGNPNGPFGFKLSWLGDTLLLKNHVIINQSITQNGFPAQLTGVSDAIMRLKKKP